jgi:hypothetical protein
MPTFSIESNGRIERTAVYYNGEQLGGIKEIFINMDEEGTFDAFIQYEGLDKNIYTKQIFSDYLDNIKTVEPSYTNEEANELQLFTIESDGVIENTVLLLNEEELNGVFSLEIHIKGNNKKSSLLSMFKQDDLSEKPVFKAEITFRNEDDSIETEMIF